MSSTEETKIFAEKPIATKNGNNNSKSPKKKKDAEPAATEDGNLKGTPKSHRKRKRHHYNAIRAQMEFYFGDANLSKDRFLKQQIDKDPYVPLDIFLTFNKMKALTSSVDEINKALSNSQLLELDETQQKVRRKTALPADRNVDEKTLYVEAIPSTADHDWVRKVFERFGAISYVSLPKYAKSRKIKEFGFVEFELEDSIEKAIKEFTEFNGVLNIQTTDPADLKSVKAFIKEQNNEDVVKTEVKTKKAKKRSKIEEDDGVEPKAKKLKTEVEDHKPTSITKVKDEDTSASETAEDETTATEDDTKNEGAGEDGTKKKKRRKKKKKSIVAEKRRKESDHNSDSTFYEIKILPKRDWKRLRNKYLNLQREKIAELKRKAWKEQQQQAQQLAKESIAAADALDSTATATPNKKLKPNDRKLQKMNMNFYGAGGGDEETKQVVKEVKQNPALERSPLFNYAEGLIVEVSFIEPCVNLKEFKSDMRQYATVKYVDVKEGALHSHLRLETASAAEDFVKQINCAEYQCKVLAGEAETEYWKKIEQDREMKLNKQVKVPQKRGREKVKKLITKHIRFGDDEE